MKPQREQVTGKFDARREGGRKQDRVECSRPLSPIGILDYAYATSLDSRIDTANVDSWRNPYLETVGKVSSNQGHGPM